MGEWAMNAYKKVDDDADPEGDIPPGGPAATTGSELPRLDEDHGEILRLLIGEGTDAALEMFSEAKDPHIDSALKAKLIGLGSRVGDNVRKAIATYARYFGGQG